MSTENRDPPLAENKKSLPTTIIKYSHLFLTYMGNYGCNLEMYYKITHKHYFEATENNEIYLSKSLSNNSLNKDYIKGKVVWTNHSKFFQWIVE